VGGETVRTTLLILACSIAAFSSSDGAVGWRNDGTGKYPAAVPPTKWSADANVVWKTPMPSWGNATSVIVGNKLFVCSEPASLVCVNLADGRILWESTNTYLDMVSAKWSGGTEDDKGKAGNIVKQFRPLDRELRKLKQQLKNSPSDAGMVETIRKLNRRIQDLTKALESQAEYRLPRTEPVCGYSSSTPVSDGKNVYVLFGTGVAACYDLAGNRKWIKLIQKPTHNYGHGASPLLAAGKLIVRLLDLIALDARSGKVLWKVKTKPWWGTPALSRIGNVDVVITPHGGIVRIADGAILADNLSKLYSGSPITESKIAYFIETGAVAIKLPPKTSEKITPKIIWRITLKNDIYYASPVLHNGLIYAITQHNFFSVIDAKDGSVVYKKKLNLGGGTVYPSITLAGDYLYVSIDNGTTIVMKPGRKYEEVARNKLEPFRSSPVFRDKRLYVRGLKNLYCIGKE
ncbi:MAG: PQQ-binding-like beta-propeller repeat protein, partial [Planctomycetota bacterium]|nr:PQQ-binding-like beta-propeller repeat protein [Planctomycetota bacterium]